MTLTYISCSSDFYTFYVNVPLSLGCMIRKVSAEDIAIRGNGTGLEYMCPTRHFVYIFFNPVFQVSTAKNEINLFNNHILIVAPVTFAPAGAMTPSAEFLWKRKFSCHPSFALSIYTNLASNNNSVCPVIALVVTFEGRNLTALICFPTLKKNIKLFIIIYLFIYLFIYVSFFFLHGI